MQTETKVNPMNILVLKEMVEEFIVTHGEAAEVKFNGPVHIMTGKSQNREPTVTVTIEREVAKRNREL